MQKLPNNFDAQISRLKAAKSPAEIVSVLSNVLSDLEKLYKKIKAAIEPRIVTYDTGMNDDIPGTSGERVFCTNDSTSYVCTATGQSGQATWLQL